MHERVLRECRAVRDARPCCGNEGVGRVRRHVSNMVETWRCQAVIVWGDGMRMIICYDSTI